MIQSRRPKRVLTSPNASLRLREAVRWLDETVDGRPAGTGYFD